MRLAAIFLLLALTQGCAGVKAIGLWVENDDTRRSFAYSWHRDRDALWETPGEDPRLHARIVPRESK